MKTFAKFVRKAKLEYLNEYESFLLESIDEITNKKPNKKLISKFFYLNGKLDMVREVKGGI